MPLRWMRLFSSILTVLHRHGIMRQLSYYQETSVAIPKKDDYMTIYYYRKGVMLYLKKGYDPDFVPPKGCVEERDLDTKSYNAHLERYNADILRLQNEFRNDLIEKYNMTNHPKANKIFNKAWDMGNSLGYDAVEEYFQDFVELFQDESTHCCN